MPTLLLVAGSVYALSILILTGGLLRAIRRFERSQTISEGMGQSLPESAVVLAARNEAAHLPSLLSSLDSQEYPDGCLQIVIVDDGSTDGTGDVLGGFKPRRHRFNTFRIDADASGGSSKKVALAVAVESSPAPYVLLTDADTAPPPSWAAAMAASLAGGCPVVAGYSPPRPRHGMLGWAACMWELGSAALAGGFIGTGFAVHVTGRNWGFHREHYEKSGGYTGLEHILSGDDTLLAQRLARHSSVLEWGFTLSPDCQVPTRPPESWMDFIRQKKRHMATAKRFSPLPLLVAVISFLLFSSLWIAMVTMPTGLWHPVGIWAVAMKVAADCVLLLFAAARSGRISMALSTPLWSIVHLFIYPLLQLTATFIPFRWKGRRGI